MYMNCERFHFLRLGRRGRLASLLSRSLTFPSTVYTVSVLIIVELAIGGADVAYRHHTQQYSFTISIYITPLHDYYSDKLPALI